jgi:hypothetical protein
MGCSSSTPKGTLTSWEEHCTSKFAQLTMQTTWMTDSLNASARIELTVARDGEKLLALDGGYVYASGGRCHPSDAVITAATGERWRAVCNMATSHDTWSWTLQSACATDGASNPELDCSVCMSPFYQPIRFPAHPDAQCGHVFCRECVVRCLSTGQTICPLCRAPLAEGMTALVAKSLPNDAATEAQFTVAFSCAPISINFVTRNPTTTWTAPPGRVEGTALPVAISIQPNTDGRVRAWNGGQPPKGKLEDLPEEQQAALLGFVSTRLRSVSRPAKGITVREVDLGVVPELLRVASKADLAVFLALLTEAFWSRGGHGNIHIAQNPWGGPRDGC